MCRRVVSRITTVTLMDITVGGNVASALPPCRLCAHHLLRPRLRRLPIPFLPSDIAFAGSLPLASFMAAAPRAAGGDVTAINAFRVSGDCIGHNVRPIA